MEDEENLNEQAKNEGERVENMTCQDERKRKILIERDTIEGHLRQVIKKVNAIDFTANEAQLLRLKEKITNLSSKAENKNNDLLFNTNVNKKEAKSWILQIFEEVDSVMEAIDSRMEKIKEEPTKSPSLTYDELNFDKNSKISSMHSNCSTAQTNENSKQLIKLKKITLPSFSGNKKEYQAWKAAFAEFVDKTENSPEYKLLQLKELLQGEAAQITSGLGYSKEAYECAMARLERKFGGSRREKTLLLEEVSAFAPVRENCPGDLDKFADLLENLVLNFQARDRSAELGTGMLYITLQQKLPLSILTQYQRWIVEGNREESTLALKQYVMQEAQFQINALETSKGISQKFTSNVSMCQSLKCAICSGSHHIESCREFLKLKLSARKNLVFKMKLCFKCLSQEHQASNCKNSHVSGKHKALQGETHENHQGVNNNCLSKTNTFTLRVIPIIVKNGKKEMKINALLDDGSQQTFLNKVVASNLGVTEQNQMDIDFSLLGGRVDTMKNAGSVTVSVSSMERRKCFTISALTTSNVAGDLRGRAWEHVAEKYQHLHGVSLSEHCDKRVDMIIGLDNPSLHVSMEERVGNSGEPLARLTPLGWSIIGPVELSVPSSKFVRKQGLNNKIELQENVDLNR